MCYDCVRIVRAHTLCYPGTCIQGPAVAAFALLISSSSVCSFKAILWDKHDSDTRYLAKLLTAKLCELETDIANLQVGPHAATCSLCLLPLHY